MMKNLLYFLLWIAIPVFGQQKQIDISALQLRNVGPAFLSGRISDVAFHPHQPNTWYVAVGSGGVWKTINAGTTWTPIFDQEASYSIGCITIDDSNPSIIWVGTGENVGGRHVGYGDGVYRSEDGGKSWKNMGLKKSEHISKIIIHPTNSNIIWVAAQGPLWSKGGERGLYVTLDGGNTWKRTLGDDQWVGVTDLVIDHSNPNILYAATWQRHRTVANYIGGGPGSGLYKSIDGGMTWEKLKRGLPSGSMGKIGLAISPQKSGVIYAAIELDRRTGAVYKSLDSGASWMKMSNTVSGGTGPHYYQELVASPHQFDRIYLMDVRIQISEDGGKTFNQLKESDKHSDNHSLHFKSDEPEYLLVGTDAGLYESFDHAETWRYIKNLPLTQFYKVAVNNAKPFYHIFGGTQDNGSAGGPSRTDERQGIRNDHWYKTLGADGHQSATDPEFDELIYAETQQGGLHRVDLKTGETVFIQPQPASAEGENYERFNWDAPILVSPHKPSRLYFASQRVFISEDRGDSWKPLSGDLTRNEERMSLPIMGKVQSWDNSWDVLAMSNYNTITSLSESPIKQGLIYVGTDDGLIQVTRDGGLNWKKITAQEMGLPERAFVNDIKADLFDEGTVYVCLDNHKEGDFRPFLLKSTDYGNTWKSITGNLPAKTLIWRLVQDHVNKNLLFAATEYGIYTSLNGGQAWQKLAGTPTIAFRDLVIQRRENDLVGASFGRGFFVLDDYSPLRELNDETIKKSGAILPVKDALWYVPRNSVGNTGADYYFAPNPEFGATITYHLSDIETTLKKVRQDKEKSDDKLIFPGWDALDLEKTEQPVKYWLEISDESGVVLRRFEGTGKQGLNRVYWDLRTHSKVSVRLDNRSVGGAGFMVPPGTYSVSLMKEKNGEITVLDGPKSFNVVPLREGTLPGATKEQIKTYAADFQQIQKEYGDVNYQFEKGEKLIASFKLAYTRAQKSNPEVVRLLAQAEKQAAEIRKMIEGSPAKNEIGEKNNPFIAQHLGVAARGLTTTYGPTALHRRSLGIAETLLVEFKQKVEQFSEDSLEKIKEELEKIGAPTVLD